MIPSRNPPRPSDSVVLAQAPVAVAGRASAPRPGWEKGMTTIGIPLYDGVDLLDFAGPLEMFGWVNTAAHIKPGQQIEVSLLAETPGEITTRAGQLTVKVCHAFADAGQLDVLWVPGADPRALACQIKGADKSPTPLIRFLRA